MQTSRESLCNFNVCGFNLSFLMEMHELGRRRKVTCY